MKTPYHFLTSSLLGTITNSWLQFTSNRPLSEFLATLEVSSQSPINTTCCLGYGTGHWNFAQILTVFMRKLTSLRLFLKIMVTPMICWFLSHKVLRQGFYKKESSTKSLKKKNLFASFLFLEKSQCNRELV